AVTLGVATGTGKLKPGSLEFFVLPPHNLVTARLRRERHAVDTVNGEMVLDAVAVTAISLSQYARLVVSDTFPAPRRCNVAGNVIHNLVSALDGAASAFNGQGSHFFSPQNSRLVK